jgi:hypothetical protein
MQTSCRGVDGDSLYAAAQKRREFVLEFAGLGTGGQPAGPQHGCDSLNLVRADFRSEKGNVHTGNADTSPLFSSQQRYSPDRMY